MITLADIKAAAATINGQVVNTPCLHSRTLSEIIGAEVYLKFENHQFTASFKERGALNKLVSLTPAQKAGGVIAASAGNHAQGVAYHATRLGIPSVIVMPTHTPNVKVEMTRRHGAEVVLFGEDFDAAKAHAVVLAGKRGLEFVHPYDDAKIIAGTGTIALEMLAAQPQLDTLVIAIGGGGLIAGMASAAKALRPDMEIVGVESARYASMHAALKGGTASFGESTIAEGIAVKEVGDISYAVARPLIDEVLLIEEPYFERGIALYCNVEKTVVEGAGAASLAALLAYPDKFRGKKCGLVITGGNIDTRLLASVLTRELVRESRIVSLRVIGDDRPGLLANVSAIIGQMGANIIEVAHNRLALDVPAKGAEFDLMIETRDRQHTQEVMDALRERGYPPRVV